MNKMERQPVISQKDSDDNENSQTNMQIRLRKTFQVSHFVRSSECLTMKFNAIIRSGYFKQFQTLSIFYTIVNGPNWKRVSGQQSGMSQMSFSSQGQIVWNFPIDIVYETDYLGDPPQIIIVFYGHDFFGRTIAKAYGNIHMPLSEGRCIRNLRTFKICENSVFSQMYSFITGSYYQFKQVEKVLTNSQQRPNLKMKTSGNVSIQFDTKRYNFDKYGYCQ